MSYFLYLLHKKATDQAFDLALEEGTMAFSPSDIRQFRAFSS
jgi:hypothetical protein